MQQVPLKHCPSPGKEKLQPPVPRDISHCPHGHVPKLTITMRCNCRAAKSLAHLWVQGWGTSSLAHLAELEQLKEKQVKTCRSAQHRTGDSVSGEPSRGLPGPMLPTQLWLCSCTSLALLCPCPSCLGRVGTSSQPLPGWLLKLCIAASHGLAPGRFFHLCSHGEIQCDAKRHVSASAAES